MASKLAAKLAASPEVDVSGGKMREIGYTSDTARGDRFVTARGVITISDGHYKCLQSVNSHKVDAADSIVMDDTGRGDTVLTEPERRNIEVKRCAYDLKA